MTSDPQTDPQTGEEGPALARESTGAAFRAYLQRLEVRLSTMHRVAGAFLGGAGLLLLLPAFMREAMVDIFGVLSRAFASGQLPWGMPVALAALLMSAPVAIAFIIPVWALWLLLQDLTVFYFSANIPQHVRAGSDPRPVFHPRFALTAIPFCNDEGGDAKKDLRAIQFGSSLKHFVLPHAEDDKRWLKDLIGTPDGEEVALPDDEWLERCPRGEDRSLMRMAFGLAGAYNRDLQAEVAKTELSLIRHNLYLRRLVLRYMKALLTLVWTALVSFCVMAAVRAAQPGDQINRLVIGFLVWSAVEPFIIRAPIRWVYSEYSRNAGDATNDPHLVQFERVVVTFCLIASVMSSVVAGGLVGWSYVWLGPVIPALAFGRSFGRFRSLKWL